MIIVEHPDFFSREGPEFEPRQDHQKLCKLILTRLFYYYFIMIIVEHPDFFSRESPEFEPRQDHLKLCKLILARLFF